MHIENNQLKTEQPAEVWATERRTLCLEMLLSSLQLHAYIRVQLSMTLFDRLF